MTIEFTFEQICWAVAVNYVVIFIITSRIFGYLIKKTWKQTKLNIDDKFVSCLAGIVWPISLPTLILVKIIILIVNLIFPED